MFMAEIFLNVQVIVEVLKAYVDIRLCFGFVGIFVVVVIVWK